jgi:starch synthase (maltosyl-transferring)
MVELATGHEPGRTMTTDPHRHDPPDGLEGRARVVIENVAPQIDGGRHPVKRVVGATVVVEADVFADGHDSPRARLLFRREDAAGWQARDMEPVGNDRWRGRFAVDTPGRYRYTVEGWIDRFGTWRRDLAARVAAGQDVRVELMIGARLVREAVLRSGQATGVGAEALAVLEGTEEDARRTAVALSSELATFVRQHDDRRFATVHAPELAVVVDRERAAFSSWYELFPRSWSPEPGRHGTFRDAARWIAYAHDLGFDVIYLPPIHPIGRQFRKGRNNSLAAGVGDVGSPWAIGGPEGGHTAIHPELGTLDDFRAVVAAARERGIDIALDLAFQCSADHPWLAEHPEWFRQRPDGTIQYAENPPKKYQDIYPLDFESSDWRGLWRALHGVVEYWIHEGVRIFRVDNPHTKAFPFWEWLIDAVKREHPDVIFLSEAFTRPRVMQRLAKIGFSQSYTYFIWRNTPWEMAEYVRELTSDPVRQYLRPNYWPNTPDILPEYLQIGGRPAFLIRLVLAATLGASYGIYGPSYELAEHAPREPGSEEYLDSEKYEIRQRDLASAWSLAPVVRRLNQVRRENPALQSDWRLRFHRTDNDMILCYSKTTEDLSNVIVVVVSFDFRHRQGGWVTLDLEALGLETAREYQVHDLLGDARFVWFGARNYVELDPASLPAHVFVVRRRTRTERDFDYYL